MGESRRFIKKIINWGGKSRDLENVIRTTRRFTDDQTAIEMVTNFYMLLTATNYLNETTYDVLVLKKKVERVAVSSGKSVNAVYKNVNRQVKKILSIFPDDLVELLKDVEKNKDKIFYYRMVSMQLLTKNQPREYQEYGKLFTFDIVEKMKIDHKYNMEVDSAEFEAAIELLQMTVTPFMEVMLEQIDVRMYGYILNLLKGDKYNLTERDLARKETLETSWLLNI